MSKITFLGDIVCDKPLLRAAEQGGKYHFDEVFAGLKELFEGSEYIVGALETTFSGKDLGYNSRSFAYNSPDELAESMKGCGINVLTLANNHCLDYGTIGLERTVHVLNDLSILNTGAKESGSKYLILQCGGVKIAILSYTAVMNSKPGGRPVPAKEKEAVNLLTEINPKLTVSLFIKRLVPNQIREVLKKRYYKNKVRRNIPTIKVVTDNGSLTERDDPYIKDFIEAARQAAKEADLVVACVHCGGQFNSAPGNRTKQLFERISPYVNFIIGNHPHVIQRVETEGNPGRAYSLGTMNLSLSADYISFENLPQYSLALHLYIDDHKRSVDRITYTLLHTEEDADGFIRVMPVKDWLEKQGSSADREKILKEISRIHSTVSAGRTLTEPEIKSEYEL